MIGHFIHALWRRIAPISHARAIGVRMGEGCRLIDVTFSTEPYLVTLGNRVSASGTHFETHDGGVWVLRERYPDLDRIAPITVGDNVFIGHGTVILPGVTIGSNVVIGAGAIVSRDIPSDSVAAGVPARVIGTLADYRDKALAEGVMTKALNGRQKREAVLARLAR
ncbi:acyltransferase [Pelagibacterium luteolum]|uniref:Transferase hexapeptide (Six repeat-containing protein) n=1 Tax=Pelagibacterium luteolum TaxID=440168 RepID=A0A1G7RUZ0_9HYPH|nr:acyltransferase [Pelagibacterium luteolum]SDG14623.1 transferase hexapeptide (six repeat-containing protein) [Pelagibacterium luteolum]